jgi:hypothetical protein
MKKAMGEEYLRCLIPRFPDDPLSESAMTLGEQTPLSLGSE